MESENFAEEVRSALKIAEEKYIWILDAFEWSVLNIKYIHEKWPEWSQEWFANEIKRIFHVDPYKYSSTVRKLGGGASTENVKKGKAIIDKLGPHKAFKVASKLNRNELKSFNSKISIEDCDKDVIAAANDILSNKKRKMEKEKKIYVNANHYKVIVAENNSLKITIEKQKKEICRLNKKINEIIKCVGA